MRRLLIVTHCFPPDPAPGSARVSRLYKYLPEFGYETYVITAGTSDGPRPRVTWVPIPSKNFGERLKRKFLFPADEDASWVQPAFDAATRLLDETPMDAVLSTFPYIHQHTIGQRLKRRFALPWIADYRDPIIGNPFRTTKGLPGMVDRFFDARFFADADLLIAVTDCVQREWIQRHPEIAAKSAVVWNGFDPEERIAPRPIPWRSQRVIAHFGGFYDGRNPAVPLESTLRLIQRREVDPGSFRFRLVGSLAPDIHSRLDGLYRELISTGCLELVPPVSRSEALDEMMESDSLFLADNNDASIGHTVPAKLFEYIRVGRPILALTAGGSPVERILKMSGVRYVTLQSAMEETVVDSRMVEFLNFSTEPVTVSREFLTKFNGRNQARSMAGLIDNLLATRSRRAPEPVSEDQKELAEV